MFQESKYEIVRYLGKNEFGEIYLGRYENKNFTIRRINFNDSDVKKQILIQLQTLFILKHPNLLKFEDITQEATYFDLAFEHYPEGNLGDFMIKKAEMTENDVVKVGKDISSALAYLHSLKLNHKDIKTENVLCGQNKFVLGGLSMSLEFDSQNKFSGRISPFVAPEIIAGFDFNSKCDIWSLGCVLYELCFKDPKFKEIKLVNAGRSPSTRIKISDKLRDFIFRCLSLEPDARPEARDVEKFFSDFKNSTEDKELKALKFLGEKKYEQALQEYITILSQVDYKNTGKGRDVAKCYNNIANCYFYMKKPDMFYVFKKKAEDALAK